MSKYYFLVRYDINKIGYLVHNAYADKQNDTIIVTIKICWIKAFNK